MKTLRRARMMRTFDSVLKVNRGVGPGFDHLRLALSLAVLFFHSFQLAYGSAYTDALSGLANASVYFILPAFFALSGFLVAGSMLRLGSIKTFATFRVLRIAPALMTEITLSALVLGPIVTALPLRQYFTDGQFAIYFTNVIGFVIHFRLPGVFLNNPVAGTVNGSLWTVPSELHCYVLLVLLMVLGIARRRMLMLATFLLLSIGECATALLPHHHYTPSVFNTQEMLVLCFLAGNALYLWRDHIPSDWRLVALAVIGYGATYEMPAISFVFAPIFITYIIAFFGLMRLPRIPLLMCGDYSYGIYLYGFPIQQTLVWAFPDMRTAPWLFIAAAPLTVFVAMASWTFVEKPTLALRKSSGATRSLAAETRPETEARVA